MTMKSGYRMGAALALIIAPLALTACGGGGSRSETSVTNVNVTKGQQLLDLKKALDSGALTQSEYDRQRAQVLAAP